MVVYAGFLLWGFEWENLIVLDRWSLTRGGHTWRFKCITVHFSQVLITYMGGKGCCHLHGLSSHAVTSEKEAVSLYQWGLANQKAAYTTVNQRSSRSHSIFTVALAMQERGSEIIIRFVWKYILCGVDCFHIPVSKGV